MKEETVGVLLSDEVEARDDDRLVETATQTMTAGSVQTDLRDESAVFIEKPAISDLQTVASAFNDAFNAALYEIEYSRKAIEERSARIDDLNGAVSSIRGALDDALDEGRIKEEAHRQETAQLSQRMQEAEIERDKLREQVCEQERILAERVAEISNLSDRVDELNTSLEQQASEERRIKEEFVSEKGALTGRLNELQNLYDEAEGRLQAQQNGLEDRDREIAELGRRVDDLLAEAEVKNNESSQLNQQVTKLQDEVTNQTESMRQQTQSHAAVREELNAEIVRVSADLETLRVSHADLAMHVEKLENLNKALQESSLTEKKVHKQQLDGKAVEVELLRSRLESGNESLQDLPDNTAEIENLKGVLQELKARLKESESRNQEMVARAEKADRLEELNARLREALKKTGEMLRNKQESATQNGDESLDITHLQEQVVDLQNALEDAGLREKEIAEKLHGYEAIEREVVALREVANEFDAIQTAGGMAALQGEVERLRSDLLASEDKCRRLEAAQNMVANANGSVDVIQYENGMSQDRTRFAEHINTILDQQGNPTENHSLIYILLDNFILIRDEIGVMESESVVRDVVKIIESGCKQEDVMARFGDCAFAVLCSNTTADEVEERANRIRVAVESRIFEHNGQSLVTTTSIGVCSVRRNDVSAENIISRVNLACEAARLSGGNRVIVSSAIADEITITGNDEDHEEMIRSTLAENRIKIYYQPISSLRDQSGNHFEVLIRLVDEGGDMILPGEFFAMAENSDHVHEVDRFIIDKVMKMMSESSDQEVMFFIKLTRQSVADSSLPDWIKSKIGEYGVKPNQLVFEVTENVMQSDLKSLSHLSSALNKIGCKVAIEHYRMSTNMQHLTHVHADYLKIDKDIVASVNKKGGSLATVTAIIDLAKQNNYVTIAEGVEDPGCLTVLWELGVSMAQGYFIQVPAISRENANQNMISESESETGSKATFCIN